MNIRSTRTYVILPLSLPAFSEIETKLREAGYEHAFDKDAEGGLTVDMHGIAVHAELSAAPPQAPSLTLSEAVLEELENHIREWTDENIDELPDPKYLHRWFAAHGSTLISQLRGSNAST